MINLNTLSNDLEKYMNMVGCEQDLNVEHEARIDMYEGLLAGALGCRAKSRGLDSLDNLIPNIKAILEWLRGTDFYRAPASTKYHGSFHGGLLLHCLTVYNKMIELHRVKTFSDVDYGSATLVMLTHDWCKINRYEPYFRNEKNQQTGLWEEKLAYKWNDKSLGLGHGPQSLMMVSQFCTSKYTSLTFDEMAAIRWHMYTYDVTSYDVNDLNKCNSQIPLTLLTQFSDQMAAIEG